MPTTESWTVGRLLTWTTDYLKSRGADNPRLDAEVLLAEARGCQRIELYTAFGDEPDEKIRLTFRELVRRRAEGMPVAYLVGRREFFSLNFRVTPDVLIPRPETELLVTELLDLVKQSPTDRGEPHGVDVGCGSGCIPVTAVKHSPRLHMTAVDLSPKALELARLNAQDHHVADRIDFVLGDLLSNLPAEPMFDFVVSNPPYVTSDEMADLPRDVRDFEPHLALDGGPEGVDLIQRLLPQAAERLRSGGHLLMEISPMIHDRVLALISADPRWKPEPTLKDFARLPRVVHARRV